MFGRFELLPDLPAFASANGLGYEATGLPPATTGIFEAAAEGVVRDRITGPGWEIGELGGGTTSRVEQRELFGVPMTVTTSVSMPTPAGGPTGYLAITLPRRMPHMILDARGNDPRFGSSLPRPPMLDQHLSLEGDFDSHFRLFVPTGYERGALYVFTPDLMALMIDEAGDFDVELRDDRLFVYARGGFRLQDPATWARFERIIEVVGAKALDRTDRYADERVGDPGANIVAPAGARMRRRWWHNPIARALLIIGGVFAAILAVIGAIFASILSSMLG